MKLWSRIPGLRVLCEGERTKPFFLLCIFFFGMSLFLTTYLCPGHVCSRNDYDNFKLDRLRDRKSLLESSSPSISLSFDQILNHKSFIFDIHSNDVIVFLHIQKTGEYSEIYNLWIINDLCAGGTIFGRHLVRDLNLENPCSCPEGRKRCTCTRPSSVDSSWLFSRYSMGWICGLHADWTELTHCVNRVMDESEGSHHLRRYFYITILRDPITRFLSEWRHVQRGATWKTSRHWCGGRYPSEEELPNCYVGENWKNVSLRQFLSCKSNLGLNRQTRMLADLNLVGCYNSSVMSHEERDAILLASAKENLRRTAFFGICENQTISQYLFESTFQMKFKRPFLQLNKTRSSYTLEMAHPKDVDLIKELNHLDVELYDYAQQLLKERFLKMKSKDHDFEGHFYGMNQVVWEMDDVEERLIQRIERQRLQMMAEKEKKSRIVFQPS